MNKIQTKVLNKLIDSYEQSKTFLGQNKVKQSFSVTVGKLFPRYRDDAEYDFFCEVNEALEELEGQSLVALERSKNGIIEKVSLNMECIGDCYGILKRVSRKDEQKWLCMLWKECKSMSEHVPQLFPLLRYIDAQEIRVSKNQKVEYFEGVHADYEDLLKLTAAVLENEEEIFIRNLSIKLFRNSKRVEQLQSKLQSLLYQYGEFEEKESVLEECGIVHTPTYVMLKGNGRITIGNQMIDLSQIKGDIALSTASIKELKWVEVLGKRVVTVENLTSFHDYSKGKDFVIYLGGFHNRIKREFIEFLYAHNPEKEYCHFGDIDAGGFYILEHLKKKTGIPFTTLHMDKATLLQYKSQTNPLTINDRKRLNVLLAQLKEQRNRGVLVEDYSEVIAFMLENNCKLEQEAVLE